MYPQRCDNHFISPTLVTRLQKTKLTITLLHLPTLPNPLLPHPLHHIRPQHVRRLQRALDAHRRVDAQFAVLVKMFSAFSAGRVKGAEVAYETKEGVLVLGLTVW